MKKDKIVILINKKYLELHFSDSAEVEDINCGAVIDYTLFDCNKKLLDGGQMEYNSQKSVYTTIEDAIRDTISFIFETYYEYEETDLDLDNGFIL